MALNRIHPTVYVGVKRYLSLAGIMSTKRYIYAGDEKYAKMHLNTSSFYLDIFSHISHTMRKDSSNFFTFTIPFLSH